MIHDVGLRFKYSHQKFRSNSLLGLSLGCIQPDLKFDLRSKSRTTLIRSLTSDSIRSSIQNLEKLHHMICNGLWIFHFFGAMCIWCNSRFESRILSKPDGGQVKDQILFVFFQKQHFRFWFHINHIGYITLRATSASGHVKFLLAV